METSSAFILGLVGSLHCAGMCGPLVLAIPFTGRTAASFVAGRLVYNCGRIFTYCALGALFGFAGKTLWLAGVQRWVSIGLGIALIIGLFVSRKLILTKPLLWLVELLKSRMAHLLGKRSWSSLAVLGLLNGLLPCGLVYVACAGAVTTGGIVAGIEYMAAFGIGTVPMILAIGLSGKLMPAAWRLNLRKAIPISVFLLAGLLILRGMSLGIPYISPDLSASSGSCCH